MNEERKIRLAKYEAELERHRKEHPEGCTCKWERMIVYEIEDIVYEDMCELREMEGDV